MLSFGKAELGESANLGSEFAITDEIRWWKKFHWWKKFELAQKALRKAFTELYMDTAMIPE